MKSTVLHGLLLLAVLVAATGCGDDSASFSVLPDGSLFFQSNQTAPMDILWVVDNSGSMQSSQDNLNRNFPSFINKFSANDYDFNMGVIGSDAYVSLPSMSAIYNSLPSTHYIRQASQASWGRFRDGGSTHSGVFIMNNLTPNLNNIFPINANLGVNGLGDERMLQSMRTALDSNLNAGFRRLGGFLAVVILTDEDDFSHDGTNYLDGQYSNANLHSVASYKSYLDTLTGSSGTRLNYSVQSIAIQDTTCRDQLGGPGGGGRRVAARVNELATLTRGIKGSLCDQEFATTLQRIAENIIQLSTQFRLSRIPIEATIAVRVNGAQVQKVNAGDGDGWYYEASTNSIMFQGSALPPRGAPIQVTFDPVGLGS